MKSIHILLFVFMCSLSAFTQINGNGNQQTITKIITNLKSIDIQFNANITLDYSLKEEMIITADENILKFIGHHFKNGKLTLDQIKWIEPSQLPTITIGTPFLSFIYQGTHSNTNVKNVQIAHLSIEGNVGKIVVDGMTKNLSVVSTGTFMDLSGLEIDQAYISIDDDSKVILDKVNTLQTDLNEDARLVLLSEVEGQLKNNELGKDKYSSPNPNLKWIDFKIKNNSFMRNHFVVVGPKKDGSRFSYGFSLFPGFSKKERWSVGTKVYKETKAGVRKLLATISSDDKGEVVDLFN